MVASRGVATVQPDLVDFLEGGVSILVGTRDAQGRPEVARGVGASLSRERTAMTIYLHEQWGAKALANLAAHPEIAVGFSRPLDHLAIQLKGTCTAFLPPAEGARRVVERYHAIYSEQLYMVGLPRSLTKRLRVWPAVGVTFGIRDIFLQTPGPEAGKRLDEGAAR